MLANQDRIARVTEREGLGAILACAPENICYVTGYSPFQAPWNRALRVAVSTGNRVGRTHVVLPLAEVGFAVDDGLDVRCEVFVYGPPNLVLDPHVELAPDEERIARIARERRFDDALSAVRAALAGSGVDPRERVAVDTGTSASVVEALNASLSSWTFTGGGDALLREIRMVKTADEVGRIRRAADLNERGVEVACSRLGADTDHEIGEAHRMTVVAQGGIVQHWQGSSARRAGAYRQPGSTRARSGDRWVFDAGIVLDGYSADTGGTCQVGEQPTAAERQTWAALAAGIDALVGDARPGIAVSELYRRGLAAIQANGAPHYRYSLLGHGIGLEPRDLPIIGPPAPAPWLPADQRFDPELEPNMVLNFETPIIELGVGGFQYEVTVRVTEGAAELLSPRREYVVV